MIGRGQWKSLAQREEGRHDRQEWEGWTTTERGDEQRRDRTGHGQEKKIINCQYEHSKLKNFKKKIGVLCHDSAL